MDINDVLPRPPGMRWGALTNVPPTRGRVLEMDRIFPPNGRWHTVFEDDEGVTVDGRTVRRAGPRRWT